MNFKCISTKGQTVGSLYSPTPLSHWLINGRGRVYEWHSFPSSHSMPLTEGRIALANSKSTQMQLYS